MSEVNIRTACEYPARTEEHSSVRRPEIVRAGDLQHRLVRQPRVSDSWVLFLKFAEFGQKLFKLLDVADKIASAISFAVSSL